MKIGKLISEWRIHVEAMAYLFDTYKWKFKIGYVSKSDYEIKFATHKSIRYFTHFTHIWKKKRQSSFHWEYSGRRSHILIRMQKVYHLLWNYMLWNFHKVALPRGAKVGVSEEGDLTFQPPWSGKCSNELVYSRQGLSVHTTSECPHHSTCIHRMTIHRSLPHRKIFGQKPEATTNVRTTIKG